jgi:hypothetical protein
MAMMGLNFTARSQNANDGKAYNNFTFYYLDNSDGYNSDAMSNELTEELRENLTKLKGRTDNYFLLYACNGTNYKTQYSLSALTEKGSNFLRQYFARPSKESEYDFDTQTLREIFTDNAIKIKQNVEINLYLSSGAIKKMTDNMGDLPTPLFFTHEMLSYLGNSNLRVVVNIYTNKKDADTIGAEKLKQYFTFCNAELNINTAQTELFSF